jgi:Fn3 associated
VAFLLLEFLRRFRPIRTPNFSPLASFFLAALLASGIACGGGGGGSVPQAQAPTTSQAATPAMQPAGGTFSTSYPTVSISDATPGSTIYFTTDGTTPSVNSAIYSAPFTVNSPITIQAMAAAASYSASAIATSSYTFQTPSGTSTITLTVTATPAGTSSKPQTLSPIPLTLTIK